MDVLAPVQQVMLEIIAGLSKHAQQGSVAILVKTQVQ